MTSAPVVRGDLLRRLESQRSCLRLLTTTDAPAPPTPCAMARPIPFVEPVTITTLPVRSNGLFTLVTVDHPCGRSSRHCCRRGSGRGAPRRARRARAGRARSAPRCPPGAGSPTRTRTSRGARRARRAHRCRRSPGSGVMRTLRRNMSPPDTSQGQSPSTGDDSDWRSSISTNRRHPVDAHLLEQHRQRRVAGEHPAVEQRGQAGSAPRARAGCSPAASDPATPAPRASSHPMSAQPLKSAAVLPMWITATMPRRVAASQTRSHAGWPGDTLAGGRPFAV